VKIPRKIEFKGYVKAMQPIVHLSGETSGRDDRKVNSIIVQKFILADGTEIFVPKVNANAVRGILRDCMASAYCANRAMDFSHIETFNLFFSGGMRLGAENEKKVKNIFSDLGIKIGENFELAVIENLALKEPLVSLLGGAVGKTMIESRINFSNLISITQETRPFIDTAVLRHYFTGTIEDIENAEDLPLPGCGDVIDKMFITRRDDALNPKNIEYFNDQGIAELRQYIIEIADSRELKKKKKAGNGEISDEEAAKPVTKSVKDIHQFEAIAAGTCMESIITLTGITDEQLGIFLAGLRVFANTPYLGGWKSRGCGRVEFSYLVFQDGEEKGRVALVGNRFEEKLQ